jgi:hypothetical protein
VPHGGPLLGDGAAPERGALALPERARLHHRGLRPCQHRPPPAVPVPDRSGTSLEFEKVNIETRIYPSSRFLRFVTFPGSEGLKPGGFKLWVTTGFNLCSPPPDVGHVGAERAEHVPDEQLGAHEGEHVHRGLEHLFPRVPRDEVRAVA